MCFLHWLHYTCGVMKMWVFLGVEKWAHYLFWQNGDCLYGFSTSALGSYPWKGAFKYYIISACRNQGRQCKVLQWRILWLRNTHTLWACDSPDCPFFFSFEFFVLPSYEKGWAKALWEPRLPKVPLTFYRKTSASLFGSRVKDQNELGPPENDSPGDFSQSAEPFHFMVRNRSLNCSKKTKQNKKSCSCVKTKSMYGVSHSSLQGAFKNDSISLMLCF